jgi:hypothetical protein
MLFILIAELYTYEIRSGRFVGNNSCIYMCGMGDM